MQLLTYEKHVHTDPAFPFFFHDSMVAQPFSPEFFHWHESIEMLYVLEGTCYVSSGPQVLTANAGDLVILNSNVLHAIYGEQSHAVYHCLIVDKSFYDSVRLPLSDMWLEPLVRSEEADAAFAAIAAEVRAKGEFYKLRVQALVLQLLVDLCRRYRTDGAEGQAGGDDRKVRLAKEVIGYLRVHFREELTMESIGKALGFSKYYLCHTFREVTGSTVVDTLNSIRCAYALQLLSSGQYTVSECAEECGFHTLSYFSKTYRRYRGRAPSEERR